LRKGIDEKNEEAEIMVAVDSVGAGVGELVLMVVGTTASRIMVNDKAPVDAAVIGIVDDIEMSGGY
jgi:ethanolamine utilization protein EutN